jgi:hypothetical protein
VNNLAVQALVAASLTCDGDLEARTGATQSCLVSYSGQSLPFAITVT